VLALLLGAGAVSAQTPTPTVATLSARETHRLLYRLDQSLQRLAHDYHQSPAQRPGLHELDLRIDEVEALLHQLRYQPLARERQIELFKTEMQIRKLRETIPNR
jgi:hypothetical protein